VLTGANRISESGWHAYIERVYGAPLPSGQLLDLNQLTFFYTHLAGPAASNAPMARMVGQSANPPTQLMSNSHCLSVCQIGLSTPTYEGTPWVGRGVAASAAFVKIGFFVRRRFPSPQQILATCGRLEVSHVRTTFKGGEKGVSWFFHTVGSGTFLDCGNLPTRGRVAAYRTRMEFQRVEGDNWDNDEAFPGQWMRRNGVAMIIFTQADFSLYGFTPNANPRVEIIVAHEHEWTSELHAGVNGICLNAGGIDIKMFSGWNGTRPCRCNPLQVGDSSFLWCN